MPGPTNLWLSDDPGKAWAERFFLLWTPVWIAAVGVVMATGALKRWDDGDFMLFSVAVSAPLLVIPALLHRRVPALAATPWYASYWFKFNLWIFLFVWVGTYFLTHYFFDVLGMRYEFPTRWNLDAALVGSGRDQVPLFLYPLTQAYFMTYHVGMTVLYRRLRTRWSLGWPARIALMFVLAYAVAFAETFFMAIPALRDVFSYPDRGRMLLVGSLFYASYFVISLPVFSQIDEHEPWTLGRTIGSALAVCMGVLIVLDGWALVFGSLMVAD